MDPDPRATAPTGPGPRRRSARRLSRQSRIALGLLLTLVGLFLLTILFPTSPSAIDRLLPVAAAGVLALWVGGILLGSGRGS